MIIKNKIAILSVGLLLATASFGQATKTVIDYLRVVGPISFEKNSYNLAWTSHPADNYYKQEYLVQGDTLEKFKRLILIELLVGKTKIKDVVATKIAELNKIKAGNPIVQYQAFEKGEEIILDFLLSENTPDGKLVSTVERNVYRYKNITDKNGQKAVFLFGVSNRAYGNDIDNFLLNLKDNRHDLLNAVDAFDLPEITIAK